METISINRGIVLFVVLIVLAVFTSCSIQGNWPAERPLGLGPNEHLISVPYDPFAASVSDRDKFPLYYFTPQSFDKSKPTILFCAGGPGQVPSNGRGNFLDSLKGDYNIVYFHPRGSGYSQVPPSNSYDKYLRIQFAVADIEAIRRSLGISRWYAVIGYSYGSILAHQYTGMYGKGGQMNTDNVDKLVLIAPMSRQGLAHRADAIDFMEQMTRQERLNLERIYKIQFPKMQGFNEPILEAVQRVQDSIERQFGTLQFVIDEYEQLRDARGQDLLKEHSADYSKPFLAALRGLRFVGWFPGAAAETQRQLGTLIATELGCKIKGFDWSVDIRQKEISYCSSADTINKLTLAEPSIWTQVDSEINVDNLYSATKKKQLVLLEEIYRNLFYKPTNQQISVIVQEVARVIDRVYEDYRGLEFVIERYEELIKINIGQKSGPPSSALMQSLLAYDVDGKSVPYGLVFFKALRILIYSDRLPAETKSQNLYDAALVIAREVAKGATELNVFASQKFVIQGRAVSYTEAEDAVNRLTIPVHSDLQTVTVLSHVYDSELQGSQEYRRVILDAVSNALEFARTKLGGCLECVVKNYGRLKSDLKDSGLDYELPFFVALQSLAHMGVSADQPARRKQRYLGAFISKEVACYMATRATKDEEKSKLPETAICDVIKALVVPREAISSRVYNVVSVYDGLHLGFLKEWLGGRDDFREALRKSAGEVHYARCRHVGQIWGGCRYGPSQYVENIGGVNEEFQIKPWDPAKYPHEVGTLILKGGADPVTVRSQPEYIISRALRGSRVLIKLPGTGHNLQDMLGESTTTENPINADPRSVCYGHQSDRRRIDGEPRHFVHSNWFGCLISSFLKLDFEGFQKARILNSIKTTAQEILERKEIVVAEPVEVFSCQKPNDCDYIFVE
jgi:pimeloyl-ACP methyl ester carboxylesterase